MTENLDNDFESEPGEQAYLYAEDRGCYWKQMSADLWIALRDAQMKRELMSTGLRTKPDSRNGEIIAPLDAKLRVIEQDQRVKFACALAGHKPGLRTIGGESVLIPKGLSLVQPKKGEWPLIAEVLKGLFVGPEVLPNGDARVIDQRDRWLAWLQHWLRSLHAGEITPGLCLCIAGEPDSGKSFIAKVTKAIVGDKEGKPYDFMVGRDNFNRELFEASMLTIDDENADTTIDARRHLAANIKKMVANDSMKLRGMHSDGVVVSVTWRLVFLVNLEAERLMVMPPIENDIADKILMLKGHQRPRPEDPNDRCWPMPMPTETPAERVAFWGAIERELPAFVHFLLEEYVAPAEVAGGRFGVQAWQHPEILRELQQFSPHVRLWQLIIKSQVVFRELVSSRNTVDQPEDVWKEREEWTGSADQLLDLLKSPATKLNQEERREIEKEKPNWIGVKLKAAMNAWGQEVAYQGRTGAGRFWRLRNRPDLIQ